MKKLLFIEDLYEFYFSKYKRSTHFSSKKSGYPLVVQVQGGLRFDDDSNEKAGLLPVHLQSCHTNLNENGSFISDENMEKSLSTFKNRPILAYIHEVDGQMKMEMLYMTNFQSELSQSPVMQKSYMTKKKTRITLKSMATYSKNIRKQQKSCRESKNVLYLLSFLLMN